MLWLWNWMVFVCLSLLSQPKPHTPSLPHFLLCVCHMIVYSLCRFLLGFVFPLMWYYATILYFGNYYRKDPRERAGLAASAIAVSALSPPSTWLVFFFWGGRGLVGLGCWTCNTADPNGLVLVQICISPAWPIKHHVLLVALPSYGAPRHMTFDKSMQGICFWFFFF